MKIDILFLAFIFCLFPYNSVYFFSPSGIQPFALFFASLIFLTSLKTHRVALIILIMVVWGVFYNPVLLRGEGGLSYIRSLIGYMTVVIILTVFARYKIHNAHKIIVYSLSLNISVAILDFCLIFGLGSNAIIQHTVLYYLKTRAYAYVPSWGRGATGLFPEPSFLALSSL